MPERVGPRGPLEDVSLDELVTRALGLGGIGGESRRQRLRVDGARYQRRGLRRAPHLLGQCIQARAHRRPQAKRKRRASAGPDREEIKRIAGRLPQKFRRLAGGARVVCQCQGLGFGKRADGDSLRRQWRPPVKGVLAPCAEQHQDGGLAMG